MIDEQEKPYTDAGWIIDSTATLPAGEGDFRPVVKCTRCGSLVNNGGLSRERHTQFHDALAELFETVYSDEFAIAEADLDLHNG